MKISIIVTCYNLENDIERCIKSIIGQSYYRWETIIVDDGSSDNSCKIIEKFTRKDSRIRLIKQHNQGPSNARNRGIREADGKYIMFIDGDDYISENYLESMVCTQSNSEDMIIAGLTYQHENGNCTIVNGDSFKCDIKTFKKKYYSKLINNRLLFGPVNKLFLLETLNLYNIRFNENIEIREDGFFVLDLLEKCSKIAGTDNTGYFYVQHDMGTTLITKFHDNETEINRNFFKKMIDIIGEQYLTKDDIRNIFPMYLNMDVSSIRKYYSNCNPGFVDGLKYIKKILRSEKFKKARRKLFFIDVQKAVKYYRPAIVFHIINWYKTRF